MLMSGIVSTALMNYDFVVNMDFGLIRFIRENYQDPKAFNLETLNKSDREILLLLYTRKNINPLSIISTEDNMKDIDALYKSFMDNCKTDISKRSISDIAIRRFINLVSRYGVTSGSKLFINASDDFEENDIKKHFPNIGIVREDRANVLNYTSYYIKDELFFKKYGLSNISKKVITGKKIYMPPTAYNIVYLGEHKEISNFNKISFIGNDYGKLLQIEEGVETVK